MSWRDNSSWWRGLSNVMWDRSAGQKKSGRSPLTHNSWKSWGPQRPPRVEWCGRTCGRPCAEIRIQDVELKHSPRRVSLNIGKSKMDQAGKGIKRTLRCCGETPCIQLCPWSLAMRALADHVNGDGRCSLFPNESGSKVTKLHLVKGWMDHIDHEMSGHSARRSGAMFYTRQGLGIHEISVLGRWKSSAVFRYIEEALEEVPLNSLILGKRPAESGRTHGEPEVHDILRSDGGQQKPPRLGKDPLPSPRQMRDVETEVKEPTAEPETKEVMNKSGNQMWAISSRRGKRLAHSVLQASWNLDLDKWATRCGWKFAAKHVKVQLTDRLPFGITKCQKCKSQAIQRRGEAKQGVRLAQLVDLTWQIRSGCLDTSHHHLLRKCCCCRFLEGGRARWLSQDCLSVSLEAPN